MISLTLQKKDQVTIFDYKRLMIGFAAEKTDLISLSMFQKNVD